MKKILLPLLLTISIAANAQFYGSLAAGFTPYHHSGYANGQLTFGRLMLHKTTFIEYSQNVAFTPLTDVPSYFQIRAGENFRLQKKTYLRLFFGSGVIPTPLDPERRVKPTFTTGLYLLHQINSEVLMKYELALNGKKIMPSIGVQTAF